MGLEIIFQHPFVNRRSILIAIFLSNQIFISPPFEVCEGWLYGEMDGKRGLVPACYVKKSSLEDEAVPPIASVDPFALPAATSPAVLATAANAASKNPFPAFTGPENHPNSLYALLLFNSIKPTL